MTYRKTKLRRRPKTIKQIGLHPVANKHPSCQFRQLTRTVASIISDHYALSRRISWFIQQKLRQTLSSRTNRNIIDAIRSDTHNPAHARRTKLNIHKKSIFQRLPILLSDQRLDFRLKFRKLWLSQPFLKIDISRFWEILL